MKARAPAPEVDLLAWPAIAAARAEVAAAKAARVEAGRKWRVAPHGKITNNLTALQEATQRVLRAEQALRELTGETA